MEDEHDFDPVGSALSDEHLHAIGYLTASASILESVINEVICHLLGVSDERGSIITAHLNFNSRLAMMKTLSDLYVTDSVAKDSLDRICGAIEALRPKRNDIVHANWQTDIHDGDHALCHKITARGKLKSSVTRYTPRQIKEIAKAADFAVRDLSLWIMNEQINNAFRRKRPG